MKKSETEIILWHTFVDMPYGIPTMDREMWTDIRIGNVRIILRESRQLYNLDDNYSSVIFLNKEIIIRCLS
ncbi:MAG: hypothetical protein LBC71_06720 [Oscillospiraceae bacterium]|nr:hypothetical protein [Oscillospiraceae bacterium]